MGERYGEVEQYAIEWAEQANQPGASVRDAALAAVAYLAAIHEQLKQINQLAGDPVPAPGICGDSWDGVFPAVTCKLGAGHAGWHANGETHWSPEMQVEFCGAADVRGGEVVAECVLDAGHRGGHEDERGHPVYPTRVPE